MSVTVTVTPYDPERQRRLAEEEEVCRAAVKRYRAERRQTRSRRRRVALNVRSVEPLVRAAESLGYHLGTFPTEGTHLESADRVALRKSTGEALEMERGESGRLIISTNGPQESIQRLVREHVLTQARAHLQSRGMDVRVRQLPTGEIQLEGRERASNLPGGRAKVMAEVDQGGNIHIDVGCLKGQRCEQIATELARAVEGEPQDVKRKAEFFQLAEPTEEQVRV